MRKRTDTMMGHNDAKGDFWPEICNDLDAVQRCPFAKDLTELVTLAKTRGRDGKTPNVISASAVSQLHRAESMLTTATLSRPAAAVAAGKTWHHVKSAAAMVGNFSRRETSTYSLPCCSGQHTR